jgi:Holliday junction resolvasome RuvABC ATP-dependent DNA helicase subunit
MSIEYLNKNVIGQTRIKPELSAYMEAMKSGTPINLMIRGQSGYGKNHLAEAIAVYISRLTKDRAIWLGEECLQMPLSNRRTHILDEIHEIGSPEFLYPFLDSGRFNFILLTNEFGVLKEPLMNRCIIVDLEPYSDEELAILVSRVVREHNVEVDLDQCLEIATYARGNPRVAKVLAKRLSLFFRAEGRPQNAGQLCQVLEDKFQISAGGFTNFDKQYLSFLEKNGKAGLDTISRVLMIPKGTLEREVEPFLIRKGLIRITSRGRELVRSEIPTQPCGAAKIETLKLGELSNGNRV